MYAKNYNSDGPQVQLSTMILSRPLFWNMAHYLLRTAVLIEAMCLRTIVLMCMYISVYAQNSNSDVREAENYSSEYTVSMSNYIRTAVLTQSSWRTYV